MITVKRAYLGPKGTYTQHAFDKYIGNDSAHEAAIAIPSISDAFEALQAHDIDEMVVPIENSVEGSVNTTMDLLAKSHKLVIQAEIELSINHALIATEAYDLSKIEQLVSHPQAFAQCREFLLKYCPNADHLPSPSTAMAAEWIISENVMTSEKKTAAIGSKELAKLHGLLVLKSSINDVKNNTTRFIVCGRNPQAVTGNDKTSFVFSTIKDQPGGLVDILSEFSSNSINLTKILSRPTQNILGDYLFFIDINGHMDDPPVAEAIEHVKNKASYFKMLGSYPKEKINA